MSKLVLFVCISVVDRWGVKGVPSWPSQMCPKFLNFFPQILSSSKGRHRPGRDHRQVYFTTSAIVFIWAKSSEVYNCHLLPTKESCWLNMANSHNQKIWIYNFMTQTYILDNQKRSGSDLEEVKNRISKEEYAYVNCGIRILNEVYFNTSSEWQIH